MTSPAHISIEGLSRSFPAPDRESDPVTVFKDVWFKIEKGEFVCLIGHSGCGKTTLLNILAGLDHATGGVVIVDGEAVDSPSLDRAVVFQSHALMPWMSAIGNIWFAVKSRWPRWSRDQIRAHCQKYIDLVRLTGSENKKQAQLSGGMKQRVGIARAMAIEPKIMLLDEPFSALDALTRGSLQDELLSVCRETGQTVFMITHDVDEALLLADKIVLMTNGPDAVISEIVVNTMPRDRTRHDMHRHAHYYPLRNHLIDFLVERATRRREEIAARADYDPSKPDIMKPGLTAPRETSADEGTETKPTVMAS